MQGEVHRQNEFPGDDRSYLLMVAAGAGPSGSSANKGSRRAVLLDCRKQVKEMMKRVKVMQHLRLPKVKRKMLHVRYCRLTRMGFV